MLVVECWLFPLPEGEGQGEGKRRFDSHWVSLIQGTLQYLGGCSKARSDLLIKQSPHPQRFRRAPGLRVAAAMRMRRVAVNDFGKVTQAMLVQQLLHAAQISPGSGDGFRG